MEVKKTQLLEAALKAVSYETHLQIQASMADEANKQQREAAANGHEAASNKGLASPPSPPAAGGLAAAAAPAAFQLPSLLTTTAR